MPNAAFLGLHKWLTRTTWKIFAMSVTLVPRFRETQYWG